MVTGSASPTSTRLSQASFQYIKHAVWQPPCDVPSQREPVKWTAFSILRIPLLLMVSHSLCATLWTVSRWPQYLSISGINGRFSNSPRSSSVARISSALRTSTTSPTRRPFAVSVCACCVVLDVTFLPFTRDSHGGFANQSIAEMLPGVVCYLIRWQTTISLSVGSCHESRQITAMAHFRWGGGPGDCVSAPSRTGRLCHYLPQRSSPVDGGAPAAMRAIKPGQAASSGPTAPRSGHCPTKRFGPEPVRRSHRPARRSDAFGCSGE